MCDSKPENNLIEHITDVHKITISQITSHNKCFLCGAEYKKRKRLVLHQYEVHCLTTFASVNHVSKIALDKKFKANLSDRKQKKRVLKVSFEIPILKKLYRMARLLTFLKVKQKNKLLCSGNRKTSRHSKMNCHNLENEPIFNKLKIQFHFFQVGQ